MIRSFLLAVALVSTSFSPLSAASLNECDWVSSVRNVWEPWEESTRTFANGQIRIVAMDTGGEPVCCSQYLVILSPNPEWGRSCTVLASTDGSGFLDVYFNEITASYDPAKGLLLSVPVGYYDYEASGVERFNPEDILVRINQGTGSVELE